MTDYSELKRLAEAAPGPFWRHHVHHHPKSNTYSHTVQTDEDWGEPVAYTETSPRSEHECAAAAFIAAANPANVLALIAELENLRGCDTAYAEVWEKARALQSEMDQVRQDAERYRWLRDSSEAFHSFYLSTPIWLAGARFSKENVDSSIDLAMSKDGSQ